MAIGQTSDTIHYDADHYEVVNGVRRELPPMGAFESGLASFLCTILGTFARRRDLGSVVVEVLFLLDAVKDLQRRPDLAFVSYARWPKGQRIPKTAAWKTVPDLAAEVISPWNTADEVMEKIQDYFRYGVQRVWVIYTSVEQVLVYDSPTSIRVLKRGDVLDEATLLPGFSLPVSSLFDEELPEETTSSSPNGAGN
ncbi:MAG: Uma2 family endonuclease [Gemmataceae bacterium]|nr:Uma2 family endonuclease [Gemmataceae bacterium]MCI0741921.1 Uma2 family endonuclease [Gemmataceae bacterium]